MGREKGKLTWLHLSDAHLRASRRYDESAVLEGLLSDIASEHEKGTLHPDLIIFTGDLAFSGKPLEYARGREFLDALLDVTQLERDHLLIVPGNHDVDRDLVGAATTHGTSLKNRDAVNSLLEDTEATELFLRRLSGYWEFVGWYFGADTRPQAPASSYVVRHTISECDVAIVGLNSAWACQGGEAEQGRILLGEMQVRKALEQCRGADLTLCLLHHPLDWISDSESGDIRGLLESECDVLLCGHRHEHRLSTEETTDGTMCVIAAGAAFERRKHSNAYNWVTLDLETSWATATFRAWVDARGGYWSADTGAGRLVDVNGQYAFRIGRQSGEGSDITILEALEGHAEVLEDYAQQLERVWRSDFPELSHKYVETSMRLASGVLVNTKDLLDSSRTIALGPLGSGKTSAAIAAAQSLIERAVDGEKTSYPLYLDCSGLHTQPVLSFVLENICAAYKARSVKQARNWLSRGYFALLFDSVGEIAPNSFNKALGEILSLARSELASGNAFHLYCRSFVGAGTFRAWNEFQLATFAPLSSDEAQQLCKSLDLDRTALEGEEPFHSPLFFILRGMFSSYDDCPTRGRILQHFFAQLIERSSRDQRSDARIPVTDGVLTILSKLAWQTSLGESIPSARVRELIADSGSLGEPIERALAATELLVPIDGSYRFKTRTSHDYFLARWIASNEETWRQALTDTRFQDAVLLAADLMTTEERALISKAALETIGGGQAADLLNFNLSSLDTTPEKCILHTRLVDVDGMIDLLETNTLTPVARFRMLKLLGQLGRFDQIPRLVSFLTDARQHAYSRLGAAVGLATLDLGALQVHAESIADAPSEEPLLRLELLRLLSDEKIVPGDLTPSPMASADLIGSLPQAAKALLDIGKARMLVGKEAGPASRFHTSALERTLIDESGNPSRLAMSLLELDQESPVADLAEQLAWLIGRIAASPFSFYLERSRLSHEKPHVSTSIYIEPIHDIPHAIGSMTHAAIAALLREYKRIASSFHEETGSLVAKMAYLDLLRQWTLPRELVAGVSEVEPLSPQGELHLVELRAAAIGLWANVVCDRWLDKDMATMAILDEIGLQSRGTVFQQVAFRCSSAGHCLFARYHYSLDQVRNPDGYENARDASVNLTRLIAHQQHFARAAGDMLFSGIVESGITILERFAHQQPLTAQGASYAHQALMDAHVDLQEQLAERLEE